MLKWRNWQTRTVQVRVGSHPWGFESPLEHHVSLMGEIMPEIVGIKVKKTGKFFIYSPNGIEFKKGDRVVIETDRGLELGEIIIANREVEQSWIEGELKPVVRKATEEDIKTKEELKQLEEEAYLFCKERIKAREMDMKLIKVDFTLDKSKAIFYFTADGRIDFRKLVRDLAHRFRLRIEMRQIGVRDEAKMIGGIGVCGRELCCTTFLHKFYPVSIKQAKNQHLILNPGKISGVCGRLMCCINFEDDDYPSDIEETQNTLYSKEQLKKFEEESRMLIEKEQEE